VRRDIANLNYIFSVGSPTPPEEHGAGLESRTFNPRYRPPAEPVPVPVPLLIAGGPASRGPVVVPLWPDRLPVWLLPVVLPF